MPIVVTREGQIVQTPQLSRQQKNTLWEIIVKNYVAKHPELFAAEREENHE